MKTCPLCGEEGLILSIQLIGNDQRKTVYHCDHGWADVTFVHTESITIVKGSSGTRSIKNRIKRYDGRDK
jgi:hypothetical protein